MNDERDMDNEGHQPSPMGQLATQTAMKAAGRLVGTKLHLTLTVVLLAALLPLLCCAGISAAFQNSTTVWPVPVATDAAGNYTASGWTITSKYGWRLHPDPQKAAQGVMNFHDGIDLAGPSFCLHCPVPAMFDARVAAVQWDANPNAGRNPLRDGGGQIVIVDNGPNSEHETLYAHLESYRMYVRFEGRIEGEGGYAPIGAGELLPNLEATDFALQCQTPVPPTFPNNVIPTRRGDGTFVFMYDQAMKCKTVVIWPARNGGWTGWIPDEPGIWKMLDGRPASYLEWETNIETGQVAYDVALRFRAHLERPPTPTPTASITPTIELPLPTWSSPDSPGGQLLESSAGIGGINGGSTTPVAGAQSLGRAYKCETLDTNEVRCFWRLKDIPTEEQRAALQPPLHTDDAHGPAYNIHEQPGQERMPTPTATDPAIGGLDDDLPAGVRAQQAEEATLSPEGYQWVEQPPGRASWTLSLPPAEGSDSWRIMAGFTSFYPWGETTPDVQLTGISGDGTPVTISCAGTRPSKQCTAPRELASVIISVDVPAGASEAMHKGWVTAQTLIAGQATTIGSFPMELGIGTPRTPTPTTPPPTATATPTATPIIPTPESGAPLLEVAPAGVYQVPFTNEGVTIFHWSISIGDTRGKPVNLVLPANDISLVAIEGVDMMGRCRQAPGHRIVRPWSSGWLCPVVPGEVLQVRMELDGFGRWDPNVTYPWPVSLLDGNTSSVLVEAPAKFRLVPAPTQTPGPTVLVPSPTPQGGGPDCQRYPLVPISAEAPDSRLMLLVAQDFELIRKEVALRSGVDALATLGEAMRPVGYTTPKPGVLYTSWHKAGRAIDLDQGGPFRLVAESRMYRVYVGDLDVTAIFESHGWRRIPQQEGSLEWWHYEWHPDNISWASAMLQVHDLATLEAAFPDIDWTKVGCQTGRPIVTPPEGIIWQFKICRIEEPTFDEAVQDDLRGCGPPVRIGDSVTMLEDVLGYVGLTGMTTGPHLHLGLKQRGAITGGWITEDICQPNPQWMGDFPTPTPDYPGYTPYWCYSEFVDPLDYLPRAHAPKRTGTPGPTTPAIGEGDPYQLPPPGHPDSQVFTPVPGEKPQGEYWSPYNNQGG